jgi:hypothetical protein
MTRLVLLLALLLALPAPGAAEVYAPVWDLQASLSGDTVTLSLTTRYVACGMAGRVDRVEGATRTVVWEAQEGIGLDTVDPYADCQCEALGTSHGTGMKSCPAQDCTKDEQCACSKVCAGVEDLCPGAGTVRYELFDLEGTLVQSADVEVPALPAGCAAAVADEGPAEPAGDSGGCTAMAGPSGGAVVGLLAAALLLLLAAGRRGRTVVLLVLALCLAATPGCRRKKGERPKEEAKKEAAPMEPVDAILEGTPWEQVVAAQTELLDFFETTTVPEETLRKVKHWKRERLPEFKEQCKAALAHYAEDSVHRMDFYVKAGRAWSVVKQRISDITREWTSVEKHDVAIALEELECR